MIKWFTNLSTYQPIFINTISEFSALLNCGATWRIGSITHFIKLHEPKEAKQNRTGKVCLIDKSKGMPPGLSFFTLTYFSPKNRHVGLAYRLGKSWIHRCCFLNKSAWISIIINLSTLSSYLYGRMTYPEEPINWTSDDCAKHIFWLIKQIFKMFKRFGHTHWWSLKYSCDTMSLKQTIINYHNFFWTK